MNWKERRLVPERASKWALPQRWRALHRFTALAWLLGVIHSLAEGTDAGQLWFLAMTAIVVVPPIMLLASRWLRFRPPVVGGAR